MQVHILWCFLVTKEFDGRVWNNTSTISAISFKQSAKTLCSPYVFQPLDRTIIFDCMMILNLQKEPIKCVEYSNIFSKGKVWNKVISNLVICLLNGFRRAIYFTSCFWFWLHLFMLFTFTRFHFMWLAMISFFNSTHYSQIQQFRWRTHLYSQLCTNIPKSTI